MLQHLKVDKWIYTLGRVVLFCLSCAIVLATSSRLMQGLPEPWSSILLATVASLGALVLTLLFVRWEGLQLGDVGLSLGRRSISLVLVGFIIGLFLSTVQVTLVLITGHLKVIRSPGITGSSVIATVLLYLLLSCREELAFRGYPLRSLNYVIGSWRAQLIVAVLFAIEHVAGSMTWAQAFLGPGVGSLLFGIASLKTKGLALPIGLHAAWNFGQWSLGFKNGSGLWQAVIEKGYEARIEHISTISYLLVMVLAILALYFYWKRPQIDSSDMVVSQSASTHTSLDDRETE